jgi:hypothetical protein
MLLNLTVVLGRVGEAELDTKPRRNGVSTVGEAELDTEPRRNGVSTVGEAELDTEPRRNGVSTEFFWGNYGTALLKEGSPSASATANSKKKTEKGFSPWRLRSSVAPCLAPLLRFLRYSHGRASFTNR